jgi:hypothetical protein
VIEDDTLQVSKLPSRDCSEGGKVAEEELEDYDGLGMLFFQVESRRTVAAMRMPLSR